MPQDMEERDIIVVDPMLATGNSAARRRDAPQGVQAQVHQVRVPADLPRRHQHPAARPTPTCRSSPPPSTASSTTTATSCRAWAMRVTASSEPRVGRQPLSNPAAGKQAPEGPVASSTSYNRRTPMTSTSSADNSSPWPPLRRRPARLRAGAGQAQGRGDLHRAVRAAMGQPHPQGAESRRGARRDRIQGHRKRLQRRLRTRDARIRHRRQPADRRRGLCRRSRRAQGGQGLPQDRRS